MKNSTVMKMVLRIVAILFVFEGCNSTPKNDCTLQLTNRSGEKISSVKLSKRYTAEEAAKLSVDSVYNLKYPAGYYDLQIDRKKYVLYLEPNFNLTLVLEKDNLNFEGKGSAENKFLAEKSEFEKPLLEKIHYKTAGLLSEEDYLSRLDSVYRCYTKHLDNYKDQLSAPFYFIESEDLYYNFERKKAMFPVNKQLATGNKEWQPSESFNKKIYSGRMNLNEDRLISSQNYINFISSYSYDLLKQKGEAEEKSIYKRLVTSLALIDSPILKETIAMDYSMSYMDRTDRLKEYYTLTMDVLTNETNKAFVKAKFEDLAKTLPGNPSPPFALENTLGDTITLKNMRGKIVYIDIWSTGCAPCLADQPFINTLKEKYKGKEIQFLGINIIDSKETWKASLEKYQMHGLNVHCEANELDFVKAYKVRGIPRYILLDKKGRIINPSAKRPYDPALIEELDELLSTK